MLIVAPSLINRLNIEAMVLVKQLVFRRNHRREGVPGNVLPADPALINGAVTCAFNQIVDVLMQHKSRCRRWQKSQCNHQDNRTGDEGQGQ